MADSRYVLPGVETVTMTGDAARRLIGCGSGDAALLYLHILQSGGVFDRDDAAAKMGRTAAQVDSAMAVLRRLQLVKDEEGGQRPAGPAQPDELPHYDVEDISREMNEGSAFPALVREVEQALGRILTAADLQTLFGIYDHLGLPPEVILQLVNHCISEYSRRYTTARRPTMRYVEQAAYTWEREGVFTLDAAEEYLRRYARRQDATAAAAEAMQISGRPLSTTERKYIASWLDMDYGPEEIAEAADRTITNTGKLAWKYMDTILRSWHGKGLHTLREIREGDARQRPEQHPAARTARTPARQSGEGPSPQELERMKQTIKKLRGED